MRCNFISAVALYGPKPEPAAGFLTKVQALIAAHVGDHFRPYSPEQIHATLVALNGIAHPETGRIINEYYLENTGAAVEMDIPAAMRILAGHLASPLQVRIGGFDRQQEPPFLSRDTHPFERTFSVQGNAFVLMGWPVAARTGPQRPLDRLRRDMNAAGVLHRYHQRETDVDDDFYLVVGHHDGAPPALLAGAVGAVRDELSASPAEFAIGPGEVRIVAADSHTMAPPRFVGDIPVDEAVLCGLMA